MQVVLKPKEEVTISGSGNSVTLINSHGTVIATESNREKRGRASDLLGFLHRHPKKEAEAGIDEGHVIVDREDWEIIRRTYGFL